MAYIFFGLILLFAGISATYLFANDFASETLEILFPAIGAILLSGYLGFKSIYLDAPQPVKFSVSIAVLHDFAHGKIQGMAPQHLPRLNEFRGAELLDTLPLYNDFKQQDISGMLRDVFPVPNSRARNLIEHFVEYALLSWLCNADVLVGYTPTHAHRLINGGGGGGSLPMDLLVATPITGGSNNPNPLLQASPLKIPLPKGSKVVRSGDRPIAFQITTPHTTLSFRYSGGGMESINRPIGKEAELIYSALGLSNTATQVQMLGINIEVTVTQSPFSRHSREAKAEAEWVNRLKEQIEKDFSWERLRALYAEG